MHLESFLKYLRFEKRCSPNTVKAYESDVSQVFEYTSSTYELSDPALIRHEHLRSWIVDLVTSGKVARTINRKISSIKTFYKYLKRKGVVATNPTGKLSSLKVPKRLPNYVQESQVLHILAQDRLDESYESYRDILIIELLYATGMRRSELVDLKDDQIDNSLSQLKVVGKGNKTRIIPVTRTLMDKMEAFRRIRNDEFGKDVGYFFLTRSGTKLYPKLVYNVVRKYLEAVTTLEQKGPHTLRHSFATHLSNHGADLNAIKELLGHANLGATQIYTHNTIEKLKKVYSESHPKAKKNNR